MPTSESMTEPPRERARGGSASRNRAGVALLTAICVAALTALTAEVVTFSRPSGPPVAAVAVLPDVSQLREIAGLTVTHPTDPDVRLTYAQCLQLAGHNLSARAEYTRALGLGADPAPVLAGRARTNLALL